MILNTLRLGDHCKSNELFVSYESTSDYESLYNSVQGVGAYN